MAGVTLHQLCKDYPNGVRAVRDLTLEVADGECVALVGASGSGKSTVLRLIAGLETITAGTVRIGGRVVNDRPPRDRDVAMVFQHYALYPHLSAFDNMAFGLRLRGEADRAEIERRVTEAAAALGLTELLDRKPAQLSGGQRQRVAVGRAVVRRPAVFLFDEPLSNLDAQLRAELRVELGRLRRRLSAPMLYVTHDQAEALTLADRIAVLERGVLRQVADPATLYARPADVFVAGFIGEPPMNLLRGTLTRSEGGGLVFADGGGVEVPLAPAMAERLAGHVGKPVRLGIRPEALGGEGPARLSARVEVLEWLGDHRIAYCATDRNAFAVKLGPAQSATVGEWRAWGFDPARVHVFDDQTGVNVI